MMRKLLFLQGVLLMMLTVSGQSLTNFSVELKEVFISGMPALQSFAWAKTSDGKWLMMCGRTDGLHDHRPPFSFPESKANDMIWLVNPETKQVWSKSISSLSDDLQNTLMSTNAEFEQVEDTLYIFGGYGVDVRNGNHKTFSNIVALDVSEIADAIEHGKAISPFFRMLSDSRFQVTGGYVHRVGELFHLVAGQNFDGRYNPHDGPSYTQTYTESIKRFELRDSAGTLGVRHYQETKDASQLRRRDYNLSPQYFPDGSVGLTLFTGVFQQYTDVPYFNTVDISDTGHHAVAGFQQLLNQYHTAHAALFDRTNKNMHTVFFGGIGACYFDQGQMIVDSAAPFVKTISRITRFSDSSMVEIAMPNGMPGYLGASAEFIPSDSIALLSKDIIDINSALGKTLIGYVVGGIESTQPHSFMFAGGSTNASNRVFKVYITSGSVGLEDGRNEKKVEIFPNPTQGVFQIKTSQVLERIQIFDSTGKMVWNTKPDGRVIEVDLRHTSNGSYIVSLERDGFTRVETIQIQK